MKNRNRTLAVLASTLAFTLMGLTGTRATAQSSATSTATTAPVAYVYVTSAPTTTTSEINAYAATSNGSLTKVPGSPFATKGSYMALNDTWLFDTDGVDIYSFKIESDGALKAGPAVDAQKFNEGNPPTGGPFNLFLDHTGKSLYDGDYLIDGANNGYQSFNVVESTGQLDFTGNIGPYSVNYGQPLSFIANNEYAYSSACVKGFQSIYGYRRNSNGTLTNLGINPFIPTPTISGSAYCPYLAAADTSNHVAISLTPFQPYTATGPPQVAVYTAASNGDLTTTSTPENMPKSEVVSVLDMKMAPSGRQLAVAGTGGLQIFHFNGASPATHFTGLLTTKEIDEMFWDNNEHLYAISRSAGKLYVFTVTNTTATPAPGSPHTITSPENVIVLPK